MTWEGIYQGNHNGWGGILVLAPGAEHQVRDVVALPVDAPGPVGAAVPVALQLLRAAVALAAAPGEADVRAHLPFVFSFFLAYW